MVISFDDELIQMPSTENKTDIVYVKYENSKYSIVEKDEYDKFLNINKVKEIKSDVINKN